ncbi:MAG TPA: alanine--tRNA ligase, partial [Chthoniobacterales bacterium]|nr:alanine--tRNA ligase [Chthoniobacterales bacterium]
MTSTEIRQSFLDFFREKKHTIVPSSSLLPDAPNLLFTNAGMNQFVPIFLGQQRPPFTPPRAADTQKCIRAGGKHNDLDDVGFDTYHHTFFEMLGNWSFGDYFKKEAIEWAWELVVRRWKFPAERLYATVYQPGPNEPSEFDQEAHEHWARLFRAAGLDPAVHVVTGNKKDNFWMMGETGPCGPCSELHVDLTAAGDTGGSLVNAGDPRCIEIWNLVFIQFNANPDGSFSPLPQRHVDTGMGFERVTAIIQGTNHLTDFSGAISNYETDIFRPIFDEIEKLSGKCYGGTLPGRDASEQQRIDVAFRVIADHIRTLSFAIADGIQPSNEGRGYVLRRILRRAVRYGRSLGLREPFFYRLVNVLCLTMGDVFPELSEKQSQIVATLKREEDSFNKTLDRGIELFEREAARISAPGSAGAPPAVSRASRDTRQSPGAVYYKRRLTHFERPWAKYAITWSTHERRILSESERDLVLQTILHDRGKKYELYVACVMPDHVHLLTEPQIKGNDDEGKPVFYALPEILQTLKSVSSHRINKARGAKDNRVWENESFDRLIRSERDFEEKFDYICRNPWDARTISQTQEYPWLWTPDDVRVSREARDTAGGAPALPGAQDAAMSAEFAFRLYDEQGFPLDLTQLMARERGLTVDTEGFEKLMEEQRARARKAQKKSVIEIADAVIRPPTNFLGYEHDHTGADVEAIVGAGARKGVILNNSVLYAEMGGQVGDRGAMIGETGFWKIEDTRKTGDTWIHLISGEDVPAPGEHVNVRIDRKRRSAIERHHTVTHLLHWALHEVVSRDATQKGSYVGPEKLTFDFASAPLTKEQVRAVEKLVNEKIAEKAPVSWKEIPYPEAKVRADIIQFFGDKYGDRVRVVQIGGAPNELNGYSMELCGGTHTRATGDIRAFRILSEGAIAAGIRRIEAIAGDAVSQWAESTAARQEEKFAALAARRPGLGELPPFENTPASIDTRAAYLERLESEVRDWEKAHAKAAEASLHSRAAAIAKELAADDGAGFRVARVPEADGKLLQAVTD